MTEPADRANRTVRLTEDLILWMRGHREAAGLTSFVLVTRAVEEYRQYIEAMGDDLPVLRPRQRNQPGEGRTPVAIALPPDLAQWLRVHCAITGRRGDGVVEQALMRYRARIEALEPCQRG